MLGDLRPVGIAAESHPRGLLRFLAGLLPDFARMPLAEWLSTLFAERNGTVDLDTIITMFEALGALTRTGSRLN